MTFDPGFSYFDDLKHLLKSLLANCNQISHRATRGLGNQNCLNCPGHIIDMAAMPVYGKNL